MVSIGKILLGVFGVAVVVILIAVPTAIFLNDKSAGEGRFFSLDDVFNSSLKPKSYNMRWISDNEYLHKSQGSVHLYDASTQDHTVFISKETFDQVDAYDYQLSADRKYVALMSNYSKLWRHSFTASYSLYDREKKVFLPDSLHLVQYFAWAPEGHKLAFVRNNDVYIKTSPEAAPERVTHSGKENQILNGIPDWVYEEEMFSSPQGLWWSPGGRFVAYAQFNDTEVPQIEYTWFGDRQYPSTVSVPYPKAGAPNPTVKLFVVEAENVTEITEVLVPPSFGASEHYLATVTWATDERVAVQWLKRVQTHLLLQIYNLTGTSWLPSENLEVISSTGWIGRFSPPEPVFAADKNSYFLIMSDRDKYKHLHRVTGGRSEQLTFGNWEVISILLVTDNSVYYVSNQAGDKPGGRNVYRYYWTGSSTGTLPVTDFSDECMYNSAYLSTNASFYRASCNGPGIPHHSLHRTGFLASGVTLEDNREFENLISNIQMPTMDRGTIQIDGFGLWYQMYLPPGFDKKKKYPLLIDVYAGPCSQKVDYNYRVNWATYLSSTEKIIVASFDGRGSGYQGDEIMHKIYKRLGTYEVEDQIIAAKEFIRMGFIDKNRVAIWGWSYGGYVTSMVLGADSGVFKCGMAVAPVSKWEYYDSIYTERYMNPPSLNQDAYNNSTVTGRAKNFHSVQYLLVHGTADDNVHFQQAAEISEALVDEQVDFEAMWYTDKDHGLGGSANQHVYTHMSHFLLRCFA